LAKREIVGVKQRIADAALRLSVERGLEAVSVRDIASSAGVSLSAINYHYQTKNNLIMCLFESCLDEILAVRLPMIEKISESIKPSLRDILSALIIPSSILLFGTEAQRLKGQFFSRALNTPLAYLQNRIDETVHYLDEFVRLISISMPEMPIEEIYWRLHFTMGIDHLNYFDLRRLNILSRGACDTTNGNELVERMIDYAVAGFCSPLISA
jgi:AcrR family transcriptional regulator